MSSPASCGLEFYCVSCGAFLAPDERTETEAGPMHPRCVEQGERLRSAPVPPMVGPMTLTEALDIGAGAIRLAASTPGGDYLAVRAGGRVLVRRVHRMSGQAGSVLEAGAWVSPDEVAPPVAWRPL